MTKLEIGKYIEFTSIITHFSTYMIDMGPNIGLLGFYTWLNGSFFDLLCYYVSLNMYVDGTPFEVC